MLETFDPRLPDLLARRGIELDTSIKSGATTAKKVVGIDDRLEDGGVVVGFSRAGDEVSLAVFYPDRDGDDAVELQPCITHKFHSSLDDMSNTLPTSQRFPIHEGRFAVAVGEWVRTQLSSAYINSIDDRPSRDITKMGTKGLRLIRRYLCGRDPDLFGLGISGLITKIDPSFEVPEELETTSDIIAFMLKWLEERLKTGV